MDKLEAIQLINEEAPGEFYFQSLSWSENDTSRHGDFLFLQHAW